MNSKIKRAYGSVSSSLRVFVLGVCLSATYLSSTAMAENAAIKSGDAVPLFRLPQLTAPAKLVDLAEYRGKVVYLDFWASWCGPCRLSMPAMTKLQKELGQQGFQVLALNMDEQRADALGFMREFPLNYPVLFGHIAQRERIAEAYGIKGMPTAYLLDKRGRLRAVHTGFRPGDEQRIRRQVQQLLAES